ncbi:MAG TPA: hypothetical protein VEX12_12915 [Microbacterium sp.]|nr:hypothetical protein [Microbacterium sp.]
MLRDLLVWAVLLGSALATVPLAIYGILVAGSRRSVNFHYGE